MICDGGGREGGQAARAPRRSEGGQAPEAAACPRRRPRPRGCATAATARPLFRQAPQLKPVDREILGMCPARPDAVGEPGDVQRFCPRTTTIRASNGPCGGGAPGGSRRSEHRVAHRPLGRAPAPQRLHPRLLRRRLATRAIGGLHYQPRYAQLEAEGKLCFDGPGGGNKPLKGDQYVIRFHGVAPWSWPRRSSGLHHSAGSGDHRGDGTRPLSLLRPRRSKKEGGVYSAPDLGGTPWQSLRTRNGTYGIASLYPTNERPHLRRVAPAPRLAGVRAPGMCSAKNSFARAAVHRLRRSAPASARTLGGPRGGHHWSHPWRPAHEPQGVSRPHAPPT